MPLFDEDVKPGSNPIDTPLTSPNPSIPAPYAGGVSSPVLPTADTSSAIEEDHSGNVLTMQDIMNKVITAKHGIDPSAPSSTINNTDLIKNNRYTNYRLGVDYEDIYHQNQSASDRIANAGINLVGKTVSYLGQQVGLVGGAPAAVVTGDISHMTDNWLTKASDVLKNYTEQQAPIYKSDKYTQGDIWQKLQTSDWWLGDATDRLALAASMFLFGAATGGMGELGALDSLGIKGGLNLMGGTVDSEGLYQATGVVTKAMESLGEGMNNYSGLGKNFLQKLSTSAAGDAGIPLKQYAQLLTQAEKYSWNVIGQSGLNAKETQEGIKTYLENERLSGKNNLSDDEINNRAAEGAKDSFWQTVPLTMVSSLIELPQMFSSLKNSKSALDKLIDPITGEAIEQSGFKSLMHSTPVKAIETAFEHGQNESAQVAVSRYNEDKQEGKLKDPNQTASSGIFQDFLDNIHDPNGQNNIALGTIQGLLMTLGGKAINMYKGTDDNSSKAKASTLQFINNARLQSRYYNMDLVQKDAQGIPVLDKDGKVQLDQDKVADAGLSLKNVEDSLRDRAQAVNDGNSLKVRMIDHKNLSELSYDFFKDPGGVKHLEGLVNDQYKQAKQDPNYRADIDDNGNEITLEQKLNDNLNMITAYKKAYDAIDQREAGFTTLQNKDATSKDITNFLSNRKKAQYQVATDQIFWSKENTSTTQALDSLKLNLSKEDGERIEDPSSPDEEKYNDLLLSKKLLDKYVDITKDNYRQITNKDEVRQAFNEFIDLKKNQEPEGPSTFINQTDEKGNTQKKEIKYNTPYSIQDEPILRQGNSITLNPTMTIHDKNIIGRYNVTNTDGTKSNLSAKDLSKYNFKTPIESKETNNIIENTLDKILPKTNNTIKVGSNVKWTSQGVDQFDSKKVVSLSDDGTHAFVEGSNTGIPVKDLTNLDQKSELPPNATLQDKIDYLNKLDNKELTDKFVKEVQSNTKELKELKLKVDKALEKLENDEEKQKVLNALQESLGNISGIKTILTDLSKEDLEDLDKGNNEENAKPDLVKFLSKEASFDKENVKKAFNQRRLSFLNNLASIQSTPKGSRIKILTITEANEGNYGLTGFTKAQEKEITDSRYLDKDGNLLKEHSLIHKLYIVQNKSNLYLSDVNGDKLSQLTKSKDLHKELIEKGIFGVFHSTLGTTKFGDNKGKKNWSGEYSEEDFNKLSKQFQDWRTETLKQEFSPIYEIENISRGIVQRDNQNKSVLEANLVNKDHLGKKGLITIPTFENAITVSGNTLNFPVGTPLLTNGSTVDILNNRKFQKDEISNLFNLLREYSVNPSQEIANFLSGIMYFSSDKEKSDIYYNDNMITFNSRQTTNLQEQNIPGFAEAPQAQPSISIPLTIESLDANESTIKDFLGTIYNNVNNKLLKDNKAFNELHIENGEVNTIPHESYQHFLLDPGYTPFLQTKARAVTSDTDPNIISRYTTIQAPEFTFEVTPKADAEVTREEETPEKEEPVGGTRFQPVNTGSLFKSTKKTVKKVEEPTPDIQKIEQNRKEELDKAFNTSKNPNGPTYNIINAINAKYDKELDSLNSNNIVTPEIGPRFVPLSEGLFKPKTLKQEVETKSQFQKDREEALKLKDQGKNKLDEPQFSVVPKEVSNYTTIDLQKELKFIQDKTSFAVNILNSLITTPQGLYAWGSYKNMTIDLYNKATEGTGYHEVFEGIWKVFTSLSEKQDILKEFNSRTGTFKTFEGISKNFSEATEQESKEKIADEFAEYILGEKPKGNFLERLFRNLLNFIKSIFSGDISNIDNLFSKINAGDFKSAANQTFSPNEVTQYSLTDVSYIQQYDFVKGVTIELMNQILSENNSFVEFEETLKPVDSFYNEVYNRLDNFYRTQIHTIIPDEKIAESYYDMWASIKEDWDKVKDLANEYLNTVGIVAEESNRDENDKSNKDYVEDIKYFQNDAKQTASRSIKLLMLTLPESIYTKEFNSDGSRKVGIKRTTSTMLGQQIAYAKTFNNLLAELSESNSYDSKIDKLRDLASTNPNIERLLLRLNKNNGPDNILNDWKLKTRFNNVFSTQQPTPRIQIFGANGSYTTSTNLSSTRKVLVQAWIDNLKASNGGTLVNINQEGNYILSTKSINKNIATIKDKVKLLNQFGIPFTEDYYSNLSSNDKSAFNRAVSSFVDRISKKNTFRLDTAKELDSAGALSVIAESFIKGGNAFDSTFFNINGERVTTNIKTNKVSRDTSDLNVSEDLRDLYTKMPQLEQIKDSLYLNSILYDKQGNRTSNSLEMGYIEGTINSKTGKVTSGAALHKIQRLIQEVNQNLNGRYYVLMPADAQTEWTQDMVNYFEYGNIDMSKVLDQFNTYYQTEKAEYEKLKVTINEKSLNKRKGIFKEISENYTASEDKFKENFAKFLKDTSENQFKSLFENQVIKLKGDAEAYRWLGLDSEFTKKNNIDLNNLSKKDLQDILMYRTVNYAFNNIELHKLFFGSPLSYTDPTKRYKLFLSPREVSIYGSKELNNTLSDQWNKDLTNNRIGKHNYADTMVTVTMADVLSINKSLGKEYDNINGADAQAYSTIIGMRERRFKAGRWTEADQKQFDFSIALDRQNMLNDGVLDGETYPKTLQESDEKLVSKGNPNVSYVYVEKPIVSGFVNKNGEYSPLLDKFSIVSWSYTAIRDTNFRDHYIKMLDNDIHYLIMESGRKVGNQGMSTFYDKEGNINTEDYNTDSLLDIPFSAFGVQTDTSGKKEAQTRGTQITKLAIVNLKDNGVPLTKEIGGLVDQNISLLKEQTSLGYHKLLKTIGAEDTGNGYKIVNKEKVLNIVKNELLRREVAENIKQALQLDPKTGDFVVPFEALPNYRQIKQILFSYVDKYITKPKVSGGPKVQVSGAMMEKYGVKRELINGKYALVSDSLKFYTKEEPWMEVLMPFSFSKELRDAGLKWNSTDELMDIIKKSPDFQDILSGIGFRIPTQELNSIDHIRIKGFLPEEMGDTIVVPEELTTKSGSDFDIDKLNTYLKNIYIDSKGIVRSVPFKGIGNKEGFEDAFFDLLQTKIDKKEESKQKTWNLFSTIQDVVFGFASDKSVSKWTPIIRKMIGDETDTVELEASLQARLEKIGKTLTKLNDWDIQEVLKDEFVDDMYKKSIENEYYRNIQKILSLPENFDRLTTPNTDKDLKSVRDQLVELAPNEYLSSGYNTIINPDYMLDTRNNAFSVKGLVGIAAISQTSSANAQLSKVIINPDKIVDLPYREKIFLGKGNIMLPHNTTEFEGKQLPTVSSIKDQEGRYITDKKSQYINGTVDVFKDAYLAQIGFSKRTAGIFLLLEELGVPNSEKHPIVGMFMNQPIIREFIKILDRKGKTSLFDRGSITTIKMMFKAPLSEVNKVQISHNFNSLTDSLKNNIKEYYSKGELSDKENIDQRAYFDEFLKYAVIANNKLRFTQGTNYDTTSFGDSNSIYFKENAYNKANEQNIFSSAESYIGNTFIGEQRDAILNSSKAIGSLFSLENPIVKSKLVSIFNDISGKYITLDEKNNLSRKLEESLINCLIQTKSGLNTQINRDLINNETSIANELKKVKESLKVTDDPDNIAGNIILKQLIPYIKGNSTSGAKNITLAIKARDIFTSNLYNDAFKQLLDHPKTSQLAKDIINVSFIQNGISASPISIKDNIPITEYAKIVKQGLDSILDENALDTFVKNRTFYKNNWNDENIVNKIVQDDTDFDSESIIYTPLEVKAYLETTKDQRSKAPLVVVQPVGFVSPIATLEYTYNEEDNPIKYLLQRVEDSDGNPVIIKVYDEEAGFYRSKNIYVHTNALGNGFLGFEGYEDLRPSQFNNGYVKIQNEINVADLAYFINSNTDFIQYLPKKVEVSEDKDVASSEAKIEVTKDEDKENKLPCEGGTSI